MSLLELIILAIIQGLTEFLPISSSAHLILPSQLLGWNDQGLAFDVAVHLGSLLAVMLYFRVEIRTLLLAWFASVAGKHSAEAKLAWLIILATIPALILGFVFKPLIEAYARSALVIAATTLIFGVLLGLADWRAALSKSLDKISWRSALVVGFAQVLAIIPGTSRSGITMTAALFLGFTRQAAARFSFLLSIPVILGAGTLSTLDLLQTPAAVDWSILLYGALLSFISAYACIFLFLRWIERIGMLPFVLYRLALGLVLLWFVFA